ncbi:hypothetical protein [Cetobacterium sp. 2G large]|uniref:hypothetical protein n=1 Tax=Cetobacterium sp. 2G large TaxID=2759680 RepID=UPI00163D2D15|nr:hypothetical protein [Cetobacterium sp. 2G large]MBC2854185.1 hypothetical protein [Cetobacterium sp. 2G large]
MRKLKMLILAATLSFTAFAGLVNGKMTKIRSYEKGNQISFESKIPNVTFKVKKVDIFKAMTRYGKVMSVADFERNGIILDVDRKVVVTLDRKGDGLWIKSKNNSMFVTERELDKIRR